jgi:uncharacterized BrkB/YihY/UPF0761 family membrane protein
VDDFPTRIPEMLETTTDRVRALTIDRVARLLKFLALGLVMITLVVFAIIFLVVGLFRILGELADKACDCDDYHMVITYAAVGGVFLITGLFLWLQRTKKTPKDSTDQP